MSDTTTYVVEESDDPSTANGIKFMIIAASITILVCICIGGHFCQHLYKQYISKSIPNKSHIRGDVCILFAVQIIATVGRAIADLFMRTDYITQSYNINMCGIGWFLQAYMPYLAKSFLFLLILYRTRIVFLNTQYTLDKCVYLTCSIAVGIETLIVGISYMAIALTHKKPYLLEKLTRLPKGNNDYYSFCRIDKSYHGFINLVTLVALILDLFWSACAGYMLISRLRKMRSDLTEMHIMEMSSIPSQSDLQVSKTRSQTELTVSVTNNGSNNGSNMPSPQYRNEERARFKQVSGVTKLEHIMYKQTILTIFALVSSILWALVLIVEKELLYGFAIDLATNLICSWLLFRFSNGIWERVYQLCCYCCRYKVRVYQ